MTKHRGPDYDPYIPTDIDVGRSIRDLADQMNRLNRNEFTVVVPCGDILPEFATVIPDELPSVWERTILRVGWAPFYPGLFLRRTRLVKAASLGKTTRGASGVSVRAVVQIGDQDLPVGSFSTFDWALDRGTARTISGRTDIDKPIPPGSPLVCETTYTGWPRQPFTDSSILFDVAWIGA